MIKKKTPNKWIDIKIQELKKEIKSNRKKYITLAIIMLLINISTIVLASLAIYKLELYVDGHNVVLFLSVASAAFIIVVFLLNTLAIFWKGVMKDKIYKQAIEKMQHEKMLFVHSIGEYKRASKKNTKIFEDKFKDIYEKALKKPKRKKIKLFFKAVTGGENA